MKRPGRIALGIGAVLVPASLVLGGALLYRSYLNNNSGHPLQDPLRDLIPATNQAGSMSVPEQLSRGERANLLILVHRAPSGAAAFHADLAMIVSMHPQTRTVTLFSIPSGVVTKPPTSGKLGNPARLGQDFAGLARGGNLDAAMRGSAKTITEILGVPIHRVAAIEYAGIRAGIDAVGGIDVAADPTVAAAYGTLLRNPKAVEGTTRLSGSEVVQLIQPRYPGEPDVSEFARLKIQQQLVLAGITRMYGPGPDYIELAEQLQGKLRTDLSLVDLRAMAAFLDGMHQGRLVQASLTTDNALQSFVLPDGDHALLPRVENWSQAHAYVRRVFEFAGSLSETPTLVVQATRGRQADAESAHRRLRELGFKGRIELSLDRDPESTAVIAGTGVNVPHTLAFLGAYFGVAPVSSADSTLPGAYGGMDTIIYVRLAPDYPVLPELRVALN